ncbi:hypothetical protein ACFQ10_39515 [Streptomyces indonesiensis]
MQLPDGSLKLPDDTVFRPDGSVKLPDGSVLHKNGALELPDGTVHHPVHEPSAADRQALDTARRARQRELAHVGAPGHEVGRAPDDLGPRASDDGPKDPPNDPPNDPPEKHTPTTSGGSHPTTHDTGTPTHDPAAPGGGVAVTARAAVVVLAAPTTRAVRATPVGPMTRAVQVATTGFPPRSPDRSSAEARRSG